MKILLIDNTRDENCWGSTDIARFLVRGPEVTLSVRRAPHDDLPVDPAAYDRLVLSGSRTSCLTEESWTVHLDRFVRTFLGLGRPFLGICYGHQVLCRVIGGPEVLRRGTTPEFGWVKVRQLQENALLSGLPNEFYTYASHYEEAYPLPPGMIHLASSERCGIQAVQLADKPIYGIQFHPEKTEEEGNRSLEFECSRVELDGVLGRGKSKSLFNERVGATIFQNFLELA